MSYYDELLVKIDSLIASKDYDEAYSLIESELKMPYIPKNIEDKLLDYKNMLPNDSKLTNLSLEDTIKYLKGSELEQLRAVDELNSLNLRDYLDICNDFLKGDGYINAKVLLVESLIKQEINEEIHMSSNGLEYDFIPKYVMLPEESLGYKKAIELLNNEYMKEPSKLELAKQLVYKECLLNLPLNFNEEEGSILADSAIRYINDAFNK